MEKKTEHLNILKTRKIRLDQKVVETGLAASRSLAQAYIMEGKIFVDGVKTIKAGALIPIISEITIVSPSLPYVSRGGIKLEHALKEFTIHTEGMIVLDGGASTGGFTDCLLARGAKKIYAVDVGYGQIAEKLRNNPKVVVLEKVNLRHLDHSLIDDPIDLITLDLSFISLEKIWGAILPLLKKTTSPAVPPLASSQEAAGSATPLRGPSALPAPYRALPLAGSTRSSTLPGPSGPSGSSTFIIALVKPQFEAGPRNVKKGGKVLDPVIHENVLRSVIEGAEKIGLHTHNITYSPLRGPAGNIEFFLLLSKQYAALNQNEIADLTSSVVTAAHSTLNKTGT